MIPNPYPGIFIVFEGIDGCGKTEQLERTFRWLSANGVKGGAFSWKIIKTEEPTLNGYFGKKIRQELKRANGLHRTNPFGFQAWFACDSKEHLQRVVIPNLKTQRSIVLSDRFRPSMVYGDRFIGDLEKLMEMNRQIIGEDFIWPDAILIFDVSIHNAMERLKKKGKNLDEHEREGLLKTIVIRYRTFAKTYPNCHLIDANGTPEEVFEKVKKIILFTINRKEQENDDN
jgi:dTMP kinase